MRKRDSRDRRLLAAVFALICGAAFSQDQSTRHDYTLDCSPQSGDLRTNEHTCRNAVITDGERLRLTAGLATVIDARGLNFEKSEWRLTEGLDLHMDTAALAADSAIFRFRADGELDSFELEGGPARFSDLLDESETPVRATAGRIVYHREDETLTLTGEVRFAVGTDGDGFDACSLKYWLNEKRYQVGTLDCASRISLGRPAAQDAAEATPDEP